MSQQESYPGYETPIPDWVPRLSEVDAQVLFPDRFGHTNKAHPVSEETFSQTAIDSLKNTIQLLRSRNYR